MEKKYKLKQEVRKFFTETPQKEIMTLEDWNKNYTVCSEILEEVPRVYVHSGISRDEGKSYSIRGWGSSPKEAHFHFTVRVQDIECKEYEEVKIPELMDEVQKVLNKYFTRY